MGDTQEVNEMANWNCDVLSICIVFSRDRLTERKMAHQSRKKKEKESRHQAKRNKPVNFTGPQSNRTALTPTRRFLTSYFFQS